ncbi:MAG: hypothetical protein AAGI46_02510 [Planctomycetota bacterium]
MPRLVSLTLLSFLALPAAALVYTLVLIIWVDAVSWRHRDLGWIIGSAAALLCVMGWWLLVWFKEVTWNTRRVTFSVLAIPGTAVLGSAVGYVAYLLTDLDTFGMFLGGSSTVIAWLVTACILWRATPMEMIDAVSGEALDAAVTCPRCSYAMTGLRDARCPECGEQYTLDQLFAAQRPDARMSDA